MDFGLWKKVVLNPTATETEKAAVDFNRTAGQISHTVDLNDLLIWAANFGK